MAIKYQDLETHYPGYNREDFFGIEPEVARSRMSRDLRKFNREDRDRDFDATESVPVVKDDIYAALSSLCTLGSKLQNTLDSIESVQNMIDDLHLTLQHYIDTGNNYQKSIDKLFKLLDESGISRSIKGVDSVKKVSKPSQEFDTRFNTESNADFNDDPEVSWMNGITGWDGIDQFQKR